MIDCHCHLCDEQFDADLPDVVKRAKQADVIGCLVNTENIPEFQKCIQLSEKYPNFVFPCIGVHPVQYESENETFVGRSCNENDIRGLEQQIAANLTKIVAIGEVGLDYTPRFIRSESDKLCQQQVFRRQIELAKRHQLPIIVHSRSAGKPAIDFMIENGVVNAVMHAFSGNAKSARAGIERGYYFSVPPSVIKSDQKKSLFDKVPLEQLLLETDSPVLGPTEERNEPENLIISCEFIAKLKKVDVQTVKRITTENAMKIFPKLKEFLRL